MAPSHGSDTTAEQGQPVVAAFLTYIATYVGHSRLDTYRVFIVIVFIAHSGTTKGGIGKISDGNSKKETE